jgi:histidinol-phosphate aminotransferase
MTARTQTTDLIREELRDLRPYESGVAWERIAGEIGLSPEEVAKLDSNENPYGPAPLVRERLAAAQLHLYPDMDQLALRTALAGYIGVAPDNIVGGNGSDELIDLIMRLTCRPGDQVVLATPTFAMYGIYAQQQGIEIIEAPRQPTDWSLDVKAMAAALTPRVRAIFVASPNNPTANSISQRELDFLLELGPLVVIDEAYGEFADVQFAPRAPQHPNLAVLRTFSKWGGLAGVRAGYLVGAAEIVEKLMVIKSPFNMGVPAQVAAIASVEQRDWLDANARLIKHERDRLFKELSKLGGVTVWPSQSNFILARFNGADGLGLRDELRARGVFTRHYQYPELSDCLRITVGRPQDSDRLLRALSESGIE